MLKNVIVCASLCVAACGGSTPTQPASQPPASPPAAAPSVLTLSGTVTATNGRQPLAGVTVEAATISSTTDSAGRYSLGLTPGTTRPRFTISGPGLLTRIGFFSSGGSRAVDLEAFALDGFDQAYFRAIARNGYEQPTSLQPLRRWTRAPMIYIRTEDDAGRAIPAEVLQQVVSIASSAVPQFTGGRFGVAAFEQGIESRLGQPGWITIAWTRDGGGFCGWADVGREGGALTLTYDQPGCSCGSQKIRHRTVKHELGHTLGAWHTGQGVDLMSGAGASECDRSITARELQYFDYLYSRPVGNADPDTDPASAVLLRPIRVTN